MMTVTASYWRSLRERLRTTRTRPELFSTEATYMYASDSRSRMICLGGPSSLHKTPLVRNSDALLLLTFLHAGISADDPRVQELLASVLAAPLDRTYSVALRAMVLEELDRVRYQSHIARCAQFLLDNQLSSGQWS